MKTRYSRRTSVLTPVRLLVAGVLGIVLIIVLSVRVLAPGAFDTVASPLWSFGDSMTREFAAEPAQSAEALSLQVQELANENLLLRTRLRDVGAERELPSDSGLLAGVRARPPVSPYDVLVLDIGSGAGVADGMVAYALGVPVGTVAQVNGSSARVLLYSAPERITEGWIGESRNPVTLIGIGSGAFEADVARELPVAEGELVYVPGSGAVPIGRVERIESHASSPRSALRIKPLVNPLTLTWVRLLSL